MFSIENCYIVACKKPQFESYDLLKRYYSQLQIATSVDVKSDKFESYDFTKIIYFDFQLQITT